MVRILAILLLLTGGHAYGDVRVTYLGNSALLIQSERSKILFEPLFRNDFGQYHLVPAELEEKILASHPPFDDIDAVFVSHYHGDHFAPADMLDYLRSKPALRLYAPRQATAAMTDLLHDVDDPVRERLIGLDIQYGDAPLQLTFGNLHIEAFNVPHSGWPNTHHDVQNLTFRVTLDSSATILHLGDADPRREHFHQHATTWRAKKTHVAFPPIWFFVAPQGNIILEDDILAQQSVAVHAPRNMRKIYEEKLGDQAVFRSPGETRDITTEE